MEAIFAVQDQRPELSPYEISAFLYAFLQNFRYAVCHFLCPVFLQKFRLYATIYALIFKTFPRVFEQIQYLKTVKKRCFTQIQIVFQNIESFIMPILTFDRPNFLEFDQIFDQNSLELFSCQNLNNINDTGILLSKNCMRMPKVCRMLYATRIWGQLC